MQEARRKTIRLFVLSILVFIILEIICLCFSVYMSPADKLGAGIINFLFVLVIFLLFLSLGWVNIYRKLEDQSTTADIKSNGRKAIPFTLFWAFFVLIGTIFWTPVPLTGGAIMLAKNIGRDEPVVYRGPLAFVNGLNVARGKTQLIIISSGYEIESTRINADPSQISGIYEIKTPLQGLKIEKGGPLVCTVKVRLTVNSDDLAMLASNGTLLDQESLRVMRDEMISIIGDSISSLKFYPPYSDTDISRAISDAIHDVNRLQEDSHMMPFHVTLIKIAVGLFSKNMEKRN